MADKLWDGRFATRTDLNVEAFTSSIQVDRRLYAYDIEGSIAHAKMLAHVGIITEDETASLVQGLGEIKREIERNQFDFDDSLEDIHMHIESRLADLVGKTARKLHTARSRNDQVALDVRMYLRDETRQIIEALIELQKTFVSLAREHLDVTLPGYTHLQRAQPVLLGHHWLAYREMLARDTERFRDCLKRINVMPLGAAALAGTPHAIDRFYTAKLLAFPTVSTNSMDAVADRDFIMEFLAAASIAMVHLSRLSEELILWTSSEFGFAELHDAFATGSSIMPQKKNPDIPELVRGKSGRVIGDLMAILTLMKSLPMTYNRDMQEDKEPLFDGVDTLKSCLNIYIRLLPKLAIRTQVMAEASRSGYLNATDLADYLAAKGMAFREAHACAGKAVAFGLAEGRELHELTLDELKNFSKLVEEDVFVALENDKIINRRTSFGGTARKNVEAMVAAAEAELAAQTVETPAGT